MKWSVVLSLLAALALPLFSVQAATLYMDPHEASMNRGDTMSISVRLDTDEGECINAIDGVITYSENIVPIDTSRGSSIMSIWLEDPVINKDNRTITFAGGIPNGYCGRVIGDPRLTNRIIEIGFSAPSMTIGVDSLGDIAEISFATGTRALLNDGFGTDAALRLFDATVELTQTSGALIDNAWGDRLISDEFPPEKFGISLERTGNAFSNRYFIVFNTTDKQSGIDYYEVIEESLSQNWLFNWGAEDAPWLEAQSPYVLKDQSLNSTIRVRAYDKAGNEYIATLVPEESQRTLSLQAKITIAVVVGAALVFSALVIGFILWWRRRKNPLVQTAETIKPEISEVTRKK